MDFLYNGLYEVSSGEKSSKEVEAIEFVKDAFKSAGHGNFVKVLRDVTKNANKRFGKTGENAVLVTLKMMLDDQTVKDNKPLYAFVSSVLKGQKLSSSADAEGGEEKEDKEGDSGEDEAPVDESLVFEGILDTLTKVATAPIMIGFSILGAICGGISAMLKSGSKLSQVYKKGKNARKRRPDSKGRQSVKSKAKSRGKVKGRKVRGVKVDPDKKNSKTTASELIAKKGGDKVKARQAAVYLMNINKKKPKLASFWKEVVGHIKPVSKIKLPKPQLKVLKMRKHKRRASAITKKSASSVKK